MIRWGRVGIVLAKELRDTLRDRRTLLMMVLVPALLYPLGGVALSQLTASALSRLDSDGYPVAIEGAQESALSVVRAALSRDGALVPRPMKDAEAALRPPRTGPPPCRFRSPNR